MLRSIKVQRFKYPSLACRQHTAPCRLGQPQCNPAAGQQPRAINAAGGLYQCLRSARAQPREHPAQRRTARGVAGLQGFEKVLQQCSALRPCQRGQCLICQATRSWQAPSVIEHCCICYRLAAAQTANHAADALIKPDPFHTVDHAGARCLGVYMQATQVVAIKAVEQQNLIDLFVIQPTEGFAQTPEHAVFVGPPCRLLAPQPPSTCAIVAQQRPVAVDRMQLPLIITRLCQAIVMPVHFDPGPPVLTPNTQGVRARGCHGGLALKRGQVVLPEFLSAVLQPSRHHGIDLRRARPNPSSHTHPGDRGRQHGKVCRHMGQMVERLLTIALLPGLGAMIDLTQ